MRFERDLTERKKERMFSRNLIKLLENWNFDGYRYTKEKLLRISCSSGSELVYRKITKIYILRDSHIDKQGMCYTKKKLHHNIPHNIN